MNNIIFVTLIACLLMAQSHKMSAKDNIPAIIKTGNQYYLEVNDQPFMIIGGELGNSTASTITSMTPVWERIKKLNLNTILLPIYWELLEPEEDNFDYQLVDELIIEARKNDLKLVILWFGSWKNSMSSHVPAWVKLDTKRFPRAQSDSGQSQELLSPFYKNNWEADKKAYCHLLRHIKEIDANYQTVILLQPENEIGMLPSARDYSPLANNMFEQEIPENLIKYLKKNKDNLNPEFLEIWGTNGFKTNGRWETVFGKGLHTDELFMAYYFAQYTDKVCAAGKLEYNLPAYVNAALNSPGKEPGQYPSAGPLPHILDIWKAGTTSIDFYAPDFYNPDFKYWCDLYTRQDNPLFVPEHRFDNTVSAKALYAVGHYGAMGFSPFSIEQTPGNSLSPKEEKLAKTYELLNQIKPLLNKNRGKNKIEGVLLDKKVKQTTFLLGDYEFTATHTFNLGWEPNSQSEEWEPSGAIIIQTAANEFYYAGFGISLTFRNSKIPNTNVGILKTELGTFKNGQWIIYRHLNGDQTHQGRHIRSFVDDISIQHFTLYNYE